MVTLKELDNGRVTATFHFPGSIWAETVHLAGEMGEDPGLHPMHYSRADDEWQVTVTLEAGRAYRFWYVLDGGERCFDRQDTVGVPEVKE